MLNESLNQSSDDQIQQDDVFQLNCKDLVVGDEFAFQLAAVKLKEVEDAEHSGGEQLYETLILAEKKI